MTGYLICATPRSGSTMLCDLLTQTGVAGRPNSYFRSASLAWFAKSLGLPGQTGEDYDETYIAAALDYARADGPVAGLRTMWNGMAPLQAKLAQLHPDALTDTDRLRVGLGVTHYLYLEREDQIAQAVSRSRAEQSGLWHRNADGTAREQNGPEQVPQYDPKGISAYLAEQSSDIQAWQAWFEANRITPHRISYDGLTRDPQGTVGGILTALGLDPARASALAPTTQKLADDISRDWASRYRAEH